MESESLVLNYTAILRTHFNSCEPVFAYLGDRPESEVPILRSFLLGLIFLFAVFGIFGNSFTIALLFRKRVSFSQLNPLFIGLSISDISVCLHEIIAVVLPQFLLTLGIPFGFSEQNVVTIMDIHMMTLYTWLASCTCSLNFIVAISLERFIAVIWPLKVTSMLPTKRTRHLAIVIPFIAGLTNISLLVYIFRKILIGQWICFLTPYYKTLMVIFWLSIPTLGIVIPNCFIIRTLFHRQKQVKEMTRQELKAMHTTKMIICIMTVYLIVTFAGGIHVTLFPDSVANYNFMNFIMTVNSSINYVIYCMFGRTFRESLTNLFCKSCRKEYATGNIRFAGMSYVRTSISQFSHGK